VKTDVVLTFVGDDKPGLVESVSRIISDHEGNWLESRLSQLAGKFAGIIRVSVDESRAATLIESLQRLRAVGLSVVSERAGVMATVVPKRRQTLTLLGLDHPGIVRDVSHALAARQINVLELNTNITRAAMTGEPMFEAEATIEYPADIDLPEFEAHLAAISREIGVDVELVDND
jgi:glycine cleavage system regulatory protein